MALTGTLRDFGIAEILQLIGQQTKSGILHLRHRDEEVQVALSNGYIVSAEYARRRQRDRIGAMLVRAELVSQDDLERALGEQARTLRRLGDVLVEMNLVSRADLRQMTTLQTTETLYQLFGWKAGTYRFEPGQVEWDAATVSPMSAESILMEGFRHLDEWPMVRRRIPSPETTFVRTGALPGGEGPPGESGAPGEAQWAADGPERRVFALAEPGRSAERIADLSRLGEFAAFKALFALVNSGLLQPIVPQRRPGAGLGAHARTWRERVRRGAAKVVATLALATMLAAVAWMAAERGSSAARPRPADEAARRFVAAGQLSRLSGALEVWRLEHGRYPDRLQSLVESRLVTAPDLRYPYSEEYYYRRKAGDGFVLLPPLP